MFEFIYEELTEHQRDSYLQRIGWIGTWDVSKETLDQLIYQHQCHVPFENLDIYPRLYPIKLDRDSLFDKIVSKRRGGFCFEMNGAFVLLLRSMGFDAYSCMCRTAANRTDLGNLAHRAIIVRLDGKRYFCDVGYGGPMAPFAVEISSKRQTQYGETYWIEMISEGWFLQKRLDSENQEKAVMIFAPQAFLPKDFEPLCQALLNNPESSFRRSRIINRRTANGSVHLKDCLLTINECGQTVKQNLLKEEIECVLREYFSIVFKERSC